MIHTLLTLNHRLESWVYANAAARTGAVGLVAADISRISFQTDTGQYWRLTNNSPVTWALIAPASALAYASVQTALANPTGITGTTTKMIGLAALLTPSASGKVLITITLGSFFTTGGAFVSLAQIRYGTGAAPANQAAAVGTPVGSTAQTPTGPGAAPATLTFLVTGLPIGVAHWIDLAIASSNAAGVGIASYVTVSAVELP